MNVNRGHTTTVTALVFLALLPGVAAHTTNPHTTPADKSAGAKMFRYHCASCHGVSGAGGLGPDLTTGTFFHGSSDADIHHNILNGIPGTAMPGSVYDDVQVWQIVVFVRSLSETNGSAPVPGNTSRGEQVFRRSGCLSCHLVQGDGGVRGPDLSVIGSQRSAAYLRESILDPNAKVAQEFWVAKIVTQSGTSYSGFVLNQDTYMVQLLDFENGLVSVSRKDFKEFNINRNSSMPSYLELSETDLNDLVSYLMSLKRQTESSK